MNARRIAECKWMKVLKSGKVSYYGLNYVFIRMSIYKQTEN